MERVFVGSKPVSTYVLATLRQLGGNHSVSLCARGRAISRAVSTAEVVRRINGGAIDSIAIGSDELPEQQRRISTIEITLKRM